MKNHFLLLIIIIFSQISVSNGQRLKERRVRKMFEKSAIMQEHFVGFMIQDESGKIIYEQNQDRHFVPASNTKLLTLYTALNVLGDSIPGLKYEIKGDSLIIWGTGDPSFLHPKLDNRRVYDFLANSPYDIYLSDELPLGFEPSYWRSDLSHFPMYGNAANVQKAETGSLLVTPRAISNFLRQDSTLNLNRFNIVRSKIGTELLYPIIPVPDDFKDRILYPVDMQVTRFLLQDTLKKEVGLILKPKPSNPKVLYSIPSDSLYKHMMLPSDNFLAEQILLLVSGMIGDTLDVEKAIDYGLENHYNKLKNTPVWEDGSGLSRFNLFTPRTVLEVLNMLEQKVGDRDRLKMMLPAGGVSGTLRNAYKTDKDQPFVWAKTGSLRYMHLQSGWIETRKGKSYRYVFMNNNFVRPTSEIRNEMVRIMTEIHEKY